MVNKTHRDLNCAPRIYIIRVVHLVFDLYALWNEIKTQKLNVYKIHAKIKQNIKMAFRKESSYFIYMYHTYEGCTSANDKYSFYRFSYYWDMNKFSLKHHTFIWTCLTLIQLFFETQNDNICNIKYTLYIYTPMP